MKMNLPASSALKFSAVLAFVSAVSGGHAAVSFANFNLVSNAGNQGMGISYNPGTFSLYDSGEQEGAVMGRSAYDPFDDMFFGQSYVNGDYVGGPNQARISASPVAAGAVIDENVTWSSRIFVNQGLSNVLYGIRYDHGGGNYSFGWLTISTPGNSLVFVSAGVEQMMGAGIEAGSLTSMAIPEPGAAALWAGFAGVFTLAARRRRSPAAVAA